MKPIFLLGLLFVGSNALAGPWTEQDTARLSKSLQNVLSTKKDDIAALHYAASTLKLLNVQPTTASAQAACDVAKKVDNKNIEAVYHAASLSADLPNCALSSVTGVKESIEAVANDANPSSLKVLQALTIAEKLAIKVDKALFDSALTTALKDTSAASLVAGINAAVLLDKAQAAKYVSKISALIAQGNIVEGKYLQFDGGLGVSADAVYGVQALAVQQGKPGFNEKNTALIANYLLENKEVNTPAVAFSYVRALNTLKNGQFVPITVSNSGATAVDLGKVAKISISNVFGQAVSVTAKASIASVIGKKIVAENVVLKNTNVAFELPLDQVKEAGVYDVAITVESQDKKLVGLTGQSVRIAIVQDVAIEGLKVGIVEKDDKESAVLKSIATFSKLGDVLKADQTKKIITKFALKSKTSGSQVAAQQVFVVLSHSSGVEQIYPAQLSGGVYTVDIALAKAHNEWNAPSGKYSLRVVVGDASIKTPIDWTFADATLTLPAAPVNIVPKTQQVIYEPLPEIQHMFRQPDKRAPAFLSSLFTLACLAPLGLLFILWLRIGINFGSMPASPWVLLFHGGLAALFGLYGVFWLQLDMFETLKYLAIIGTFTFLAGNRLLRLIADKRKAKTD